MKDSRGGTYSIEAKCIKINATEIEKKDPDIRNV